MTSFVRPSPDLDKILEAWQSWTTDDEALPGRTMADLKIGGIDRLLADLASDRDDLAAIAEVWQRWEKGRLGPGDTLEALEGAGFGELTKALDEAR